MKMKRKICRTLIYACITLCSSCVNRANDRNDGKFNKNENIIEAFNQSKASDPDYQEMLKSGHRVEIKDRSIYFKGDASVCTMIVFIDDNGYFQAYRHVDFGIKNDGYYQLKSENWHRCTQNDWEKILGAVLAKY